MSSGERFPSVLPPNPRGPHEEGLAFQPARPALLASQLLSVGINVAAIQEARTAEGSLRTGPFLRFCSGAVKGHFGVELWFHLDHKLWNFGSSDSAAICFEANCCTVLVQDPRRLGVLFRKGSCQIVFFALHAPHRGKSSQEIAQWWADTEDILFRSSNGKLLVAGADCNARVESEYVSSCGSEEQDQPGDLLHSCLHKCGLWAPATFADVQSGPTWTFVQRRNGATTRPDFVFLPLAWRASLIQAWTSPEIVAANMVIDHQSGHGCGCSRYC